MLVQVPELHSMTTDPTDKAETASRSVGTITSAGAISGEGKTEVLVEEVKLPDKEIYSDHIKLRFFMRGDEKRYCAAFKRAHEEKNAELQVALADAYFAAVKDNDINKDFSVFDPTKFKIFTCLHQKHVVPGFGIKELPMRTYCLYEQLYIKTFGTRPEMELSIAVYQAAVKTGFASAVLFDIVNPLWFDRVDKVKDKERLRMLAESGYHEAMLEYGKALMRTNNLEEQAIGLKYMYDSGFLTLEYLRAGEEIEDFLDRHLRPKGSTYVVYEDLWIITHENVVLVPYEKPEGYFEKLYSGLVKIFV